MSDRRKPVAAPAALFLTVGVPRAEAGKRAIKRAAETLQKEGFRVGITSDEAVLAMAEQIQLRQASERNGDVT